LLVAWRSSASRASPGVIPQPSSATAIQSRPPPRSSTRTRLAPASSAFSTSSFTTEAGRSTTSPAAIWSISASSRRRTRGASAELDMQPPTRLYHGAAHGVKRALGRRFGRARLPRRTPRVNL
jgi:hypothetical protein